MSKTYLPYEPDQQMLLPAALQEWLPDDSAYFISDVVDQLRRSPLATSGGPSSTDDGHSSEPPPSVSTGHPRVLAANNTPDFRTISDFRKDNLDALSGLFVQVLALCQQAGLVKLGHVALDGTKVKAKRMKH